MCGFVDVDVDVGQGVAEEDQIATVIIGIPAAGWEGHYVATELTSMDGEAAPGVDEGAE